MAEAVKNNIVTLISANTIGNIRTEIIWLDILLSIFFIWALNAMLKPNWDLNTKCKKVYNYIFGINDDSKYSYTIKGEIFITKSKKHFYFTLGFKAVLHYLYENNLIKSFSEFPSSSYDDDIIIFPKLEDKEVFIKEENIWIKVIETKTDNGCEMFLTITSKNSVKSIHEFIAKAKKEFVKFSSQSLVENQYYIYPSIEKTDDIISWKRIIYKTNKKWEHVFFNNKENIINHIDNFINNKSFYEKKGIPWTLGILLYGKPGTGKTSFIKALSSYTNRHLIEVPLNNINTYEQLKNVFFTNRIGGYNIPYEERIYLIEDIDCLGVNNIIKTRENKNETSFENKNETSFENNNKDKWTKLLSSTYSTSLTLSHLLNIIDGPIEIPGRILIITTNHPEKIDPALFREGRIDIKIEMKPINKEPLSDMITSWYGVDPGKIDPEKLKNTQNYTPAKIENMCFKYPMEKVIQELY